MLKQKHISHMILEYYHVHAFCKTKPCNEDNKMIILQFLIFNQHIRLT